MSFEPLGLEFGTQNAIVCKYSLTKLRPSHQLHRKYLRLHFRIVVLLAHCSLPAYAILPITVIDVFLSLLYGREIIQEHHFSIECGVATYRR